MDFSPLGRYRPLVAFPQVKAINVSDSVSPSSPDALHDGKRCGLVTAKVGVVVFFFLLGFDWWRILI